MRLAHSYSEPMYVVTMRAHILLWQCGGAGGRSFEVDHLSHMGKCDLYYHISQSVNITKERDITGVAITNLA